jgi:hypothetical protein
LYVNAPVRDSDAYAAASASKKATSSTTRCGSPETCSDCGSKRCAYAAPSRTVSRYGFT